MTWLHSGLLAGLVAAALPLIIHLIGKRRAKTVRFAAFDFLMAVNKRLAKREKIRQFLLLLFRTLALVALVLAVSRPITQRQESQGDALRRWVFVVDTSASMNFEIDGETLLQRAQAYLSETLTALGPSEPVIVVMAGEEVRVPFTTPTLNHAAVKAAVLAVELGAGKADLGDAIDRGLGLLGETTDGAQLVVISDLSASSFVDLRPTGFSPMPTLRLVDVAERDYEGRALGNVAIQQVDVSASQESLARVLAVTLQNYGTSPFSAGTVELLIQDKVVQRGYVDIDSRGTVEKRLTYNFSEPGIYPCEVRWQAGTQGGAEDGYAHDDAYRFVVHIQSPVKVLLVNGDPRTTPFEDELFFAERALLALPVGQAPIDVTIVSQDGFIQDFSPQKLAAFGSVVLANVSLLPETSVGPLQEFVSNGGGLLFSLGSKSDFEAMNSGLAGLLPHRLRDLHRAQNLRDGSPAVGIGRLDWQHAILDGLGEEAQASLAASKTRSYFNLAPGSSSKVRTLIRFDNGAPALIERTVGKGRVMMLTTSIDADLSDLVLRSAFVPLLQRTIRYLSGASMKMAVSPVREGDDVTLPIPTGIKGIALIPPQSSAGERRELTNSDRPLEQATFSDLKLAGVYGVQMLRGAVWERRPAYDVVVNPTLDESDFMPIVSAEFSQRLSGEADKQLGTLVVASSGLDPFEARGFAAYFLLALALLFCAEGVLAARG